MQSLGHLQKARDFKEQLKSIFTAQDRLSHPTEEEGQLTILIEQVEEKMFQRNSPSIFARNEESEMFDDKSVEHKTLLRLCHNPHMSIKLTSLACWRTECIHTINDGGELHREH